MMEELPFWQKAILGWWIAVPLYLSVWAVLLSSERWERKKRAVRLLRWRKRHRPRFR